MKWTLVVPGALPPAQLASELACAVQAPRLAQLLAHARLVEDYSSGEGSIGAPHWSWLARALGASSDPPVTAPYAWHALAGAQAAIPRGWVAFCDPVHMAVGHDAVVLTDLGDAPLQPDEAEELFSLANDVLQGASAACGPESRGGLRLEARAGQWFLHADEAMDLQACPLDAVLGQAVHRHMPHGADARRWRKLANEIQMLWHASAVNLAREQRGARLVNALWVHGGGRWQPLPATSITQLVLDEHRADAAVLRGWLLASDSGDASQTLARTGRHPQGDWLAVCRALSVAFATQSWESWLERLNVLEDRLDRDLASAQARDVAQFELVLCGVQQARTLHLPLHRPWWRRLRNGRHASARSLQRWLAEPGTAAEDKRPA